MSPCNRTPATEEVVDFVRIFVGKGGLRCWKRSVTFATDWTFDLRNVVDDQDLKEQVDKARALLEGVSTDALRNMPLIRARVREGMAELATQMDALAGDRVSRKFRFAEE